MKTRRLWILVPVVGLALLLVGFLVGIAARTDAGPRGADASSASQPPSFTYCDGTYALCTTAQCTPIPGKAPGAEGLLSCPCDVMRGHSAGQQVCAGVPKDAPSVGQLLTSRYHPFTSMAICTNENNQPWAWCLDMPCIVTEVNSDKNSVSEGKATCFCVTSAAMGKSGKGDYVVVADTYNNTTCPTGPNSPNGFISSATICGVTGINDFYNSKHNPPNPPIKILNNITPPPCPPPQ